jgi:hypothetical protein
LIRAYGACFTEFYKEGIRLKYKKNSISWKFSVSLLKKWVQKQFSKSLTKFKCSKSLNIFRVTPLIIGLLRNINHATILKQFIKSVLRSKAHPIIWESAATLVKEKRTKQFSEKLDPRRFSESVYIIRRRPPGGGLFSNINHVLQGILRAEYLKLIPVVDAKNYWTSYNRSFKIANSYNSWNYFFEPVSHIDLESLTKNSIISLSPGDKILENHWLCDNSLSFMQDKNKISELNDVIDSKIRLNKYCLDLLDDVKKLIKWNPEKTLGVSYRGTEYIEKEPKNHSRQPSINDIKLAIRNELLYSQYEKILVCSEDINFRKVLINEFGKQIHENFRQSKIFIDILAKNIPGFIMSDKNLIRTFGYLIETYLLSETYNCVASIANGSSFAFLLNNNKYTNPKIFNLGVY